MKEKEKEKIKLKIRKKTYSLAIIVEISQERTSRASEREHRKRNRNRDINTDLSGIDLKIGKLTHQTIHPESLALASRSASHRHLPERGHEGRSEFSRRSSSHARSEDDRGRDRDPQGDRYRRAPKVTDAFFDRPYEPQKREEAPTWEAAAPRKPMRSSLSANIRPRRPMAALFKAPQPASAPVADPAAGSTSSASSRSTS